MHRIVSLSPAATELVEALGLAEALVGGPHGGPPSDRPVVTRSAFGRAPAEPPDRVAVQVRDAVDDRAAVIEVDEEAIRALRPTLVLQGDEGVCGARLEGALTIAGRSLDAALDAVSRLGRALDEASRAERLRAELRERLDAVHRPPRDAAAVLPLIWGDPPWVAGGLVAELVVHVGGTLPLGAPDQPARPIRGAEMVSARPDLIFYLPCGYTLDESEREARAIAARPEARAIDAVRGGRMWALAPPRSIVSAVALAEAMASALDGEARGARRIDAPA